VCFYDAELLQLLQLLQLYQVQPRPNYTHASSSRPLGGKKANASAGHSVCACGTLPELVGDSTEHGANAAHLGELRAHKDGLGQRGDVLVPLRLLRLPHAPGHASKLRVVEVERGLVKVRRIRVCVIARPALDHARVACRSAHTNTFHRASLPRSRLAMSGQ